MIGLIDSPVVDEASVPARPAADEASLLALLAAGERGRVLEELYDRYERRLYGLGLRLLGDPSLAEELVQETFLRVWRRAAQFDPTKGTVATFIFTIARRIAIDLWRRPSSRPFEASSDHEAVAEDPVEQVLVQLAVRDALDALSPAHREVLELSYGQDLKQRDIASRLGLPLGTVKTRTYHALRALKQTLDEEGIHG